MYSTGGEIRFKTPVRKLSLSDYSDAYNLVSGKKTITGGPDVVTADEKRTNERNKDIIFKNCGPFTKFKNEINDTK